MVLRLSGRGSLSGRSQREQGDQEKGACRFHALVAMRQAVAGRGYLGPIVAASDGQRRYGYSQLMNDMAMRRSTADEFLEWAMERPEGEHYELAAAAVIAMAPERAAHGRVKSTIGYRLRAALEASRLPCEVYVNNTAVQVDSHTVYEPDVLLRCGDPLADDFGGWTSAARSARDRAGKRIWIEVRSFGRPKHLDRENAHQGQPRRWQEL